MMRVGFIGLGHMGLPMARRLAARGYSLTVWNRTTSRATSLVADGATLAESPQALARQSDVVITMLSDAAAAQAVLCGSGSVLSACRTGSIAVEMSTIGPHVAREIAAEAARRDIEFLDSPVSGSVTLAEQGALTTMVGGSEKAFDRVRPVLAALSRNQIYLGPAGAGAAMKLAVNIIIAATNQSVAEALALAEESGIDRTSAYDTLASSAVASPFINYKRDAFLHPDITPVSFTTALMSKDLDLAIDVAGDIRLPVTTATRSVLDAACAAGFSEADFACVAQFLRRAATSQDAPPSAG